MVAVFGPRRSSLLLVVGVVCVFAFLGALARYRAAVYALTWSKYQAAMAADEVVEEVTTLPAEYFTTLSTSSSTPVSSSTTTEPPAPTHTPKLGADVFEWNTTAPPAWLAQPVRTPLRLRIAVVTHPSEFARRRALRELVFADVPAAEVEFTYRFFLGAAADDATNDRVAAEALECDDMFVLNMLDTRHGLGAKRWEALLWVRSPLPPPPSAHVYDPGRGRAVAQLRLVLHHRHGRVRALRRARAARRELEREPHAPARHARAVGPHAHDEPALARRARRARRVAHGAPRGRRRRALVFRR
jgi:hypothetical protein